MFVQCIGVRKKNSHNYKKTVKFASKQNYASFVNKCLEQMSLAHNH